MKEFTLPKKKAFVMYSLVVMAALLSLTFVGNALAGSISKGRDNRGVELTYEGFNLGSNGVVRFSLECVKNWGGQVGGAAYVVAFYLDDSDKVKEISDSCSCYVRGGDDGARKKSKGSAKTLKIPVPLSEAEVRVYIDYKETSNIDDTLKKLENVVNKTIEDATRGVVKKPLTVGKTLEQAVAPAGGDKLTFE